MESTVSTAVQVFDYYDRLFKWLWVLNISKNLLLEINIYSKVVKYVFSQYIAKEQTFACNTYIYVIFLC